MIIHIAKGKYNQKDYLFFILCFLAVRKIYDFKKKTETDDKNLTKTYNTLRVQHFLSKINYFPP